LQGLAEDLANSEVVVSTVGDFMVAWVSMAAVASMGAKTACGSIFDRKEIRAMKNVMWLVVLFPAALLAQSAFDGTWVVKLEQTQLPKKPEVYFLQNGVYECDTCIPRIKVKADGKDYPMAGSPYFSMVSVRQTADGVEITEKHKDKVVYSETDSVSADGKTLTEEVVDMSAPNGEPVKAKEVFQRVAPGPDGASKISGSWQAQQIKVLSANGMTVTYHATEQGLQASTPGGEGYDAKFDGKEYRVHGVPVRSTVCLKRVNARTIEETDKTEGRVHYRVRMAVLGDGNSMKVTEIDEQRGTTMNYVMEKKAQ